MQVIPRIGALAALACVSTAALATPPTSNVSPPPGTILLMRPMSGIIDGFKFTTGTAIFSIQDDGFGLRQLTSYNEGVYNMPGLRDGNYVWMDNWVANAFAPSGRFSLYLEAHSNVPHYDTRYLNGKYFIINAQGQRQSALFPGGNDLQKPKDGPSFGAVTWGPAGTHLIAYGNSLDGKPVSHACVYLMHPDGTGRRKLWCARGYYPDYYQAIGGIRWSGDGKSLLVYASLTQPNHQRNATADLYLVDATTGAGTLVEPSIESTLNGGTTGDVSYDGHEALYETRTSGSCSLDGQPWVVCATNLLTHQSVALVDPDHVQWLGGAQMLLSPDGSQAVLRGYNPSAPQENDLYLINTDGTGLRKITGPCVPTDADTEITWRAVRLSPDGTQMLANCNVYQVRPTPSRRTNRIYVINLTDDSARYITNGTAYDWHKPSA